MRVWKKFPNCWRCDFFDSAQTVTASRQNALHYDWSASGSIIYTYVDGNPVSFVDPRGLCLEDLCIGEAIVVGRIAYQGYRWYRAYRAASILAKALSPADEAQKDIDHLNYHNTCEKKPPEGLTPCELARWQYRQAMSCQAKREEWEQRWGTPETKEVHERGLANVKNRLKNAAADIIKFCTCK